LEVDHNLVATATRELSDRITGVFTVGQNLNSRRQRELYVEGNTLIAPLPYVLQNTLISAPSLENRTLRHIEAYFVQGELSFSDQLVVNLGLRNDGFSTFGAAHRRANYPKASAAWTFLNDADTSTRAGSHAGWINYGKLRFAYGETGNEPPPYASVNAFTNVFGFGGAFNDALGPSQSGQGGITTSPQIGNPALKPERSREGELGLDLGLFEQRVDLATTVYNKRSTDVILPVTINAAQTGALTKYLNGASISNKGTEISMNTRPYTSKNVAVELGVEYGRNKGKVLSLTGTQSISVNGGVEGFRGAQASHTVGYAPGVLRGFDFVRCGRGIRATVAGVGVDADVDSLCAADAVGGKYKSGALVLGSNGQPISDPTERVIADPHPKYTMGYNGSIQLYNRLRLSTLVDVRKGGQVINATRASLYRFGTHQGTLVRSMTDGTFGVNFATKEYPDVTGPGKGVVAFSTEPQWEAWFQTLGSLPNGPLTQFVEDGGFVKLRELAVTYTVSSAFLKTHTGFSSADLRVAGRNLHTWTKYTGLDPEADLGGAQFLSSGIDYFNSPQTRSLVLSVSLNR
jgi:hypothetical protein